jgi:hypothetical protein
MTDEHRITQTGDRSLQVVTYEVMPRPGHPDEWRVEARDPNAEPDVTLFVGPDAYARAAEVAAWKNSLGGQAHRPALRRFL